jgi:hypothetical protein
VLKGGCQCVGYVRVTPLFEKLFVKLLQFNATFGEGACALTMLETGKHCAL